jgi:hypothetical protein
MRAYVFQGRVDEVGVLVIAEAARWRARLARMHGKDVEIRVALRPEAHSLNQLAYLWGVVYSTFAEHIGQDSQQTHEDCKAHILLSWEDGKLGRTPRIKSVSELTMSELSDYIDRVRTLAAGLGCYIPGPNEPHEVTL